MRSAPDKTESSKKFSVHVPGAGEYKCYLSIQIRVEGYVGVYVYVKEGPIFPVTVALAKFTCGAHTSQYVDHLIDSPCGYGFSKFMSDAEAEAAKTAEGCLSITAKIQLKCDSDSVLSI
jgi:hypothetical protein